MDDCFLYHHFQVNDISGFMLFNSNIVNPTLNFLHFLCQSWELVQFVHDLSKGLIQSHYFGNYAIYCDQLRLLDRHLLYFLHLIYFRHLIYLVDYLLYNCGHLPNLLHHNLHRDYFLYQHLHRLYLLFVVGNLILDYSNFILYEQFLDNLILGDDLAWCLHLHFNYFLSHLVNSLNEGDHIFDRH